MEFGLAVKSSPEQAALSDSVTIVYEIVNTGDRPLLSLKLEAAVDSALFLDETGPGSTGGFDFGDLGDSGRGGRGSPGKCTQQTGARSEQPGAFAASCDIGTLEPGDSTSISITGRVGYATGADLLYGPRAFASATALNGLDSSTESRVVIDGPLEDLWAQLIVPLVAPLPPTALGSHGIDSVFGQIMLSDIVVDTDSLSSASAFLDIPDDSAAVTVSVRTVPSDGRTSLLVTDRAPLYDEDGMSPSTVIVLMRGGRRGVQEAVTRHRARVASQDPTKAELTVVQTQFNSTHSVSVLPRTPSGPTVLLAESLEFGASSPYLPLDDGTVQLEVENESTGQRDTVSVTLSAGVAYTVVTYGAEAGRRQETTAIRVYDGEGNDLTAGVSTSAYDDAIPLEIFQLFPTYPNPFATSTRIAYSISGEELVKLQIYDIYGRAVRTLVEGRRAAGRHELTWDGRSESGVPLASGVYVYRLSTGAKSVARMVTVVR